MFHLLKVKIRAASLIQHNFTYRLFSLQFILQASIVRSNLKASPGVGTGAGWVASSESRLPCCHTQHYLPKNVNSVLRSSSLSASQMSVFTLQTPTSLLCKEALIRSRRPGGTCCRWQARWTYSWAQKRNEINLLHDPRQQNVKKNLFFLIVWLAFAIDRTPYLSMAFKAKPHVWRLIFAHSISPEYLFSHYFFLVSFTADWCLFLWPPRHKPHLDK